MKIVMCADVSDAPTKSQISEMERDRAYKGCSMHVMPDVHAGRNTPCGIVVKGAGKLNPSLVGPDIGCGVMAVPIQLRNFMGIDSFYREFDWVVQRKIPSGFALNDVCRSMSLQLEIRCKKLLESRGLSCGKNIEILGKSMGTLGGGNHFIEIDYSEKTKWWMIIHTGSRGFGKIVASYWAGCAEKNDCFHGIDPLRDAIIEWMRDNEDTKVRINDLVKSFRHIKDLSRTKYATPLVEKSLVNEYLNDMEVCCEYAFENRETIARTLIDSMAGDIMLDHSRPLIDCVHNYAEGCSSDWTVRKSSIDASEGKMVIIPFNMRDGAVIGIGKGNKDWACSAPHGSGRRLSRTDAKKYISLDSFREDMSGVFSSSVNESTLDEAPDAYKDTDGIIDRIGETVDVVDRLSTEYNFKAGIHE